MKDWKIALALIAVLICWLTFPIVFNYISGIEVPNSANNVGDMYGVLNVLFSGLTLIFVIYAVFLQKDELKAASKALNASSYALEEQNKTQKIQRFENTFFGLLNLYTDTVNSVEKVIKTLPFSQNDTGERYDGKRAVAEYAKSLKRFEHEDVQVNEVVNIYLEKYEHFYRHQSPSFAHYFRTLYRFFKFIDEAEIEEKEKMRYAKLLRAQLSNDELVLLFFNSLDEEGRGKKFRAYIIKYALFNNMDLSFFDKKYRHMFVSQYPWFAYGPSGQNESIL